MLSIQQRALLAQHDQYLRMYIASGYLTVLKVFTGSMRHLGTDVYNYEPSHPKHQDEQILHTSPWTRDCNMSMGGQNEGQGRTYMYTPAKPQSWAYQS